MSDEFRESVEEMLANNLTVEASVEIMVARTGKPGRDWKAESTIMRTILVALKAFSEQMAAPRVGTMTFEQAMQAVREHKLVTRPGWAILRVLRDVPGADDDIEDSEFHHQRMRVSDFILDNLDGAGSGSGGPYSPSDDDLAATDWMLYQPPIYFGLSRIDV